MEAMLATIGGILVLLSVGGGILMQSLGTRQYIATFDRMFAGLIGMSVILAAIGLGSESSTLVNCGAAGGGVFTVAYAALLWQRERGGARGAGRSTSRRR